MAIRVIKSGRQHDNRQPTLWGQQEFEERNGSLEGRVQDTLVQVVPEPRFQVFNHMPNYGVTIKSLAPFLKKVNPDGPDGKPVVDMVSFFALWELVHVLNNTESLDGKYGFSHEILIRENTPETLARLIALHPIKQMFYENPNSPQVRKIVEYARKDFPHFVSKEVNKIYKRVPAVREVANNGLGYNGHPTHRGAYIKRMEEAVLQSSDIVERAVKSMTLTQRHPGETTKELKYPYRYPSEGIKRDTNYELRLHYAWAVVDFFNKLYIANTRTRTQNR